MTGPVFIFRLSPETEPRAICPLSLPTEICPCMGVSSFLLVLFLLRGLLEGGVPALMSGPCSIPFCPQPHFSETFLALFPLLSVIILPPLLPPILPPLLPTTNPQAHFFCHLGRGRTRRGRGYLPPESWLQQNRGSFAKFCPSATDGPCPPTSTATDRWTGISTH